jgi:NAD-dependent SIR2 family protein deacetylase
MPLPLRNPASSPLEDFVAAHARLFVLTGAGCSTASGIPDYRDAMGQWKRKPPVTLQAFISEETTRRRYWARSLVGWPMFSKARPNDAHRALARLEALGGIELLLTQNVDGLHQAAGSRHVIDLHGRLDAVRCLDCGRTLPRADFQTELQALNPGWLGLAALSAPDGDADLEGLDFSAFAIPPCPHCGGLLKPDVVFFGENVPKARVAEAMEGLGRANAVLVVGSSLMVYSGYRFVDQASRQGKPIAAISLGRTRADEMLSLKVEAHCEEALRFLL